MQFTQINVTGMTCSGCSSKVAKALNAVNGAVNVIVSLPDANAIVEYDEKLTSPAQLKLAIKEVGYEVDSSDTLQHSLGKECCE